MQIDHVFGNHIYVISNYGVARNPIFANLGDLKTFEKLVEKYLHPVCDIISFDHSHNQFQYLIKVNPREDIEQFYIKKQSQKIKNERDFDLKNLIIPETYVIFSQQVSNLLNAYVKRFNIKYNRRGGLFAARYRKILVESEELLYNWIDNLKNSIPQFHFSRKWRVKKKEREMKFASNGCDKNGIAKLWSNSGQGTLADLEKQIKEDLRGCFECLPPRRVNSSNIALLWTNFFQKNGFPPPW